jgi:hypothetical protein
MHTWSGHFSDQWPTGGSGKPCWPLCFPRNILITWTNIESYSPFLTIPSFSEIWSLAPLIPSLISVLTNAFTRSRDNTSPWPNHMLASFIDVISPSGPRVPIHHADAQIPILMHMPQRTTSEYHIDIFMITLLRCAGWWSQGNLSWYRLDMISWSMK